MTAFWISAYAGNLEVFHTQKAIKELYTEGADINILSNYGESALYIACKNNKLDCVKYLCHIGLDINALFSRSGISAVGIASYGGFLGIVKFLNYKKASLILCEKNTWKTPLFLACKSRQYEIAEYLINFSEVTSYSTPFDFSPLIVCILNRNEKLLSLLLKNQVGIYLKNQKNETILAKAVEIGNANIVKLIYTHHRELNSENNDGITPFMASLLMHKYDIAQAMFELDANVYYKNKRGKTIIDIAKEHNDKNLLKKLFILGFTENIELNDNPDTCCLDICEREIDSHMNKSRENNNRLPSLRSYLSTDKERIRECINYKVHNNSIDKISPRKVDISNHSAKINKKKLPNNRSTYQIVKHSRNGGSNYRSTRNLRLKKRTDNKIMLYREPITVREDNDDEDPLITELKIKLNRVLIAKKASFQRHPSMFPLIKNYH